MGTAIRTGRTLLGDPVLYGRLVFRLLQRKAGRKLPLFASFFVTNECNLRCVGCIYFERLDPVAEAAARPFFDGKRILEEIKSQGIPMVAFVGGEPLMRPDLFDLADHARSLGLGTALITNGTLITEKNARDIERLFDYAVLSLDGLADVNDLVRGKGSFAAAIDGFSHLKKTGRMKKVTTITISRTNIDSMGLFLEYLAERTRTMGRLRLQPNNLEPFFPTKVQADAFLAVVLDFKKRHPRILLGNKRYLGGMLSFWDRSSFHPCPAPELFHIGIHADGEVSACCSNRIPIGNLNENGLGELLARAAGERFERRGCYGCYTLNVLPDIERHLL